MKNNFIVITIFVMFYIVTLIPCYSQEWGKVSDEELSLRSIEDDPEADAVILFDKAKIYITPDFELVFKRHKRVKILTEKGKEQANVSLYYSDYDDLFELEAQSFLPNGEDFELDEDNIFDESTNKLQKKVFAIPGVEMGSVIEYYYELYSDYIHYLEPWYFQNDIFTKLSEITIFLPTGFKYSAFKNNTVYHDVVFNQSEDWDPYSSGKRINKFTWTARNLPAIKEEPYMNNLEDYIAKLSFQLVSFRNRYVDYKFIKTWDDLAKNVRKLYDDLLSDDDGVADIGTSLIIDSLAEKEKVKRLYEYVRDKIETIMTEEFESPETLLENKKGDIREKNLLLLSLLRNMGFKAFPVLISTKQHGKFYPQLVQLRQFNHTIIMVKIGNKNLFLDTKDKYCPFGILPINSAVGKGLLIDEDSGKIINISQQKLNNETEVNSIANLDENGTIEIESNIIYNGYVAIGKRIKLKESENEEEYIKDIIANTFENAVIDSYTVLNYDKLEKPFTIFIKFKVPEYAQFVGDMIYVRPPFLISFEKNPFTSSKRYFPVDYAYTYRSSQKTKLNFPSKFVIVEIPEKSKANFNKMSFTSIYFKQDNAVELNRSYRRRKLSVASANYEKLKKFYDVMVESDQSQFVLRKF